MWTFYQFSKKFGVLTICNILFRIGLHLILVAYNSLYQRVFMNRETVSELGVLNK